MINFIKNITHSSKLSLKSITLKWTLLTALSISILLGIFGYVTFQISSNVLINEEKNNFTRTMDEVSSRLGRSRDVLTLSSSVFYLKETAGDFMGNTYYDRETLESNLMNLNTFISELSQPELNVKIYSDTGLLLFETKNFYLPFDKNNKNNMTIDTFNNRAGLFLMKPIYSKETNKLVGYAQGFFELNSYYSVREDLFKTLVTIAAVGIIVGVIISFLLSSYFTYPLRKMAKTINEVEEFPLTNVRMPVPKGNDELADLANAFNLILGRMQLFIQRQQQFVEDVSHELRTPVAVIEGHLNLLNRWGKDDPQVLDESLEASLQEIIRMKSLVQEMLDLSRAEQSEFHYKDRVSNAKEVIHTTVNNFRMLYPEFTFNLDDDLSRERQVKIYRNHFEQILVILLDNAVKYSNDRKEILISMSKSHKYLEVMVQDFGEGISPDNVEQVFNRFYRVDKARARHTGGNGLGLSIASQLVDNYEGQISLKSVLNHGSAFTFYIPLVPDEQIKTDELTDKKKSQ
ncbi:ATP-binding protein [Vagococcus vulneris]|uniref:Signal transduction histidine-protein kinase ArlS n=1 Tax=Vagococcus vulneris TaxID=1977869 RepID=A0A429ZWV4_9ENTE|nr:HAMP domain-containing histidine kinase [Vagococcus vulneris]RST98302.1 hypothetical protein CBF37_08305 [Vagococcus vulneris]